MELAMYSGFNSELEKNGIEKTAEKAKALGFSSVEHLTMYPENSYMPTISEASRIRKTLDAYGLPMACYSVCIDLYSAENGVEFLKGEADRAAELGSPFLHHTLIMSRHDAQNAPSYSEAIKVLLEKAVQVAEYAETLGIRCIYEDQGFYVNGVNGFGGFFNEMKKACKGVGVCGDFGNILFADETAEDFFKAYAKDILHVHVKDYLFKNTELPPSGTWARTRNNNWLRDTVIGDGIVNFERGFEILKEAGYNGRFSLENCHPEPFEMGVAQAFEYLNRLW